ncbi:MAG: hypothetical protein ACI8XC_004648, partial [Gammaproteobacteria bacterium]
MHRFKKTFFVGFAVVCLSIGMNSRLAASERPLIDAHIHYSHDAWQKFPPEEAVKLLRTAGLKHAFVSSSNDESTQ